MDIIRCLKLQPLLPVVVTLNQPNMNCRHSQQLTFADFLVLRLCPVVFPLSHWRGQQAVSRLSSGGNPHFGVWVAPAGLEVGRHQDGRSGGGGLLGDDGGGALQRLACL